MRNKTENTLYYLVSYGGKHFTYPNNFIVIPELLVQQFSRLKQQLPGLQYPPPRNNHFTANGQ